LTKEKQAIENELAKVRADLNTKKTNPTESDHDYATSIQHPDEEVVLLKNELNSFKSIS
jgi:hypothetical protein